MTQDLCGLVIWRTSTWRGVYFLLDFMEEQREIKQKSEEKLRTL